MTHHNPGDHGTGKAPSDGEPKVIDNAVVGSEATLSGGILLSRRAVVDGSANLNGAVEVTDHGHVGGKAVVSGNVLINGNGKVDGNAQVTGDNIHIGDDAVVDGDAVVVGQNIAIKHRAHVTGSMRIGDHAQILNKGDAYHWDGGHDGQWTVFRTSEGHANGIEGDSVETIYDLLKNDRAPHELRRQVKQNPFNKSN